LAFHPYPQLIPIFFNRNGFEPPLGVTRASLWPWVDRIGFGSAATYSAPCSDSLSLRLRFFRSLTSHVTSNSPDHNAKGTQSGPQRPLLPLVGTRFQDLFHSPSGVLFTFPSRYLCAIGHGRVCSLGGWSPQIPTGFLVSRRTQVPKSLAMAAFRIRGSHPLRRTFPGRFRYAPSSSGTMPHSGPTTPHPKARFGLLPVRSPLLRESRLISFPGDT
jgi:hypothetical protein